MTAATLSNALETELERELTERWEDADRDLDSARRHVEIAVGTLWRLLPRWLDDPAAWVGRWACAIVLDLDELDRLRELPGGGR